MADIYPFRGITYNKKKIKDYSQVLTQPYDKIDDKMQAEYYQRHPNNHIRITKPIDEVGDNEHNNKYTRAGQTLNKWLQEGILVQDNKPTIYGYYQQYQVNGQTKVRKGFIALGKLVEFGKGGVHPHERTLVGPKQDRLKMMRAVGASTGQIFMLYSDPKQRINSIMDKFAAEHRPDIVARDEYNVIHKVWKIQEPKLLARITKLMKGRDIFIADGHHRYETALNYRDEMKAKGLKCTEPESYNNRMMTFVNMDDTKGLTILPTHRLIFGLADSSLQGLTQKLAKYFIVREYPYFSEADEKTIRADFLSDLRQTGLEKHAIGLVVKDSQRYSVLILRDEKVMDEVVKEKHSKSWKRLDVTILHSLILETILGLSRESIAREENIHYVRGEDKAIDELNPGGSVGSPLTLPKGNFQLAFLLNPTRIQEVQLLAGRGERMPQKSTDFFPKLLSGLVISRINYL